jgi:hypothetical protein
MEKTTRNADREGEYMLKGCGIEVLYMLQPNHSSDGLNILVGKVELRKALCCVE